MTVTFLRVNELISFYATDYNMSKFLSRILGVEMELHTERAFQELHGNPSGNHPAGQTQ